MNDHSAHTYYEPPSEGGGPPGQSAPQEPKANAQQYFIAGKIIAHIEHLASLDPRELARLINEHLLNPPGQVNLLSEVNLPGGVNPPGQVNPSGEVNPLDKGGLGLADDVRPVQPRNILTFPRPDDQMPTFSIVPVELKRTDQQSMIDILSTINKGHGAKPFKLAQDVVWKSESPNWLLGSAGHGGPHPPSPGSWPLARTAPTKKDWKFYLREKDSDDPQELPFAAEKGANVHVAILDTAPCASDLDEAYETWHDTNELIERLIKPEPNRKLRLITDIYAEIELMDSSVARHRYWMANHGLFVAGEIESIAPESTIHLIKVFTSYGSASTLTLAQGIIRVLTDDKIGRPLVVNCSFGLAVPVPGFDDPDFPVDLRNSPANPDIEGRMQTSLRALFEELINQEQVIVVAAAGDDTDLDPQSNPGQQRAPARLPAAYEKVIAVGALPRGFALENGKYKAATYSNRVDVPNPPDVTGYMTLGGEHGRGKGILGIYISEIPKFQGETEGKRPKDPEEAKRDHLTYTHNQEGNAEWAGASFAAPIVTGLVANWCSEQLGDPALITLDNVRQALNGMSQTRQTKENERVILVKQG